MLTTDVCVENQFKSLSSRQTNESLVDSNFNIIQYEQQSASFNHQLNAQICCLCVVKRWRRDNTSRITQYIR